MCKSFVETDLRTHERIRKSRALGTNKQVSSSSICKYNLLQKAGTFPESLYRPGKVGRLLWVQGLRYKKCILNTKKITVYHKLEKKEQSTMASARLIRAKFQDLGN